MSARSPKTPASAPATVSALSPLVVLVLGTFAAAGCGPGFNPYNRLLSLRVLAIRSQPVAPAAGEETTIDAKVYAPDGMPPDSYAWSWCPFAGPAGAPCPVTEDDLSMAAGVPISFDLGSAPTAKLTNAIPPAVLEAACAGRPGVPAVDCTDGFPVQIQLTVHKGNETVQAVRPLRLRFRAEDQPNNNPTIDHLYALIGDPAAPVPLPLDPLMSPPELPRHEKTVIGAVVMDGAESYQGKDDDGNVVTQLERLNLSWFVETGDTDHQRTAFIDGTVATLEEASKNKWTPAFHKDYPLATARVVVIIRDDREGQGWAEGLVTLRETP